MSRPPLPENPLVSIVVPSFNHARYLPAAIESVLEQDYAPIELIVIDDGSTDGSADILRGYGTKFRWELQPNQGQVATLNRGWLMSKGDVLGYLSADDLLMPSAVGKSVRCLQRNPDAVLAYCDFNLIDPHSAIIRRVRAPDFDYRSMVTQMVCPPGPGAFFRRWAFEKAGTWHTGFQQMLDYEYWLRLGLYGRFVRIPEVLAAYRVHPGSQSFASINIRTEEPIQIMEAFFANPALPAGLREARKQSLGAAHLHCAHLNFRAGNYRRGFSAIYYGFRLNPRGALSRRTLRVAFNILFNRISHRVLWSLRRFVRAGSSERTKSERNT